MMAVISFFYFHSNYTAQCQNCNPQVVEKIKPFFLNKGLLTLLPTITVALKNDGGWLDQKIVKDMDSIWIGKSEQTLAALMSSYNIDDYYSTSNRFFCPSVLKIDEKGSWSPTVFYGPHKDLELVEACRQKRGVFYPYKDGLLIFYLCDRIGSDFFDKNEQRLKDFVDTCVKYRLK